MMCIYKLKLNSKLYKLYKTFIQLGTVCKTFIQFKTFYIIRKFKNSTNELEMLGLNPIIKCQRSPLWLTDVGLKNVQVSISFQF